MSRHDIPINATNVFKKENLHEKVQKVQYDQFYNNSDKMQTHQDFKISTVCNLLDVISLP